MSLSDQNRATYEATLCEWIDPGAATCLLTMDELNRLIEAVRAEEQEAIGSEPVPKPLQAEGAPAAEGALLSEHQARDHLRILLGEMSVNCWAKTHGLTAQQVDSFLRGVRPLEPKLAGVLGLVRTPFYHRRIDHV